MQIFGANESSYCEAVNFVDINNVFVGYSLGQDCCEHASWFISDTISPSIPDDDDLENKEGVEAFVFDPEFFQEVQSNELDEGEMVAFRLVSGDEEKYLHLFNSHNGYYSHGFTVKHGDEIVRDGYL